MNCKKLAILVLAHKNPEQLNALTESLYHPNIDIYIHIDKKSKMDINQIISRDNVFILEEEWRVPVFWGQISQLDATLNLLRKAHTAKKYSYYVLISGEDFPCKSIDEIYELAKTAENRISFWQSLNNGTGFNNLDKRCSIYFPRWMITRKLMGKILKKMWIILSGGYNRTFEILKRKNNTKFYHGPSWWGLNFETIDFILNYIDENPSFYKYFRNCSNPDESFFQTMVMLSPYANSSTKFLTYVYFLQGKNSPELLTKEDCKKAIESEFYFMRKVDLEKTNLEYLHSLFLEDK